MDLLQIEALLFRLRPLLTDSLSLETTAVRSAAIQWSQAIDALINELRRTGVESAISCGMSVEPQSDMEFIELSVLSQELLYRIRETRLRVEAGQSESPELGASALVIEFLELLKACERSADSHESEDGSETTVMSWSKLFSVGVREIDEQHRVLIGLLNRLGAVAESPDSASVVSHTLADLVKYVGHHFAFEEKLMREHAYEETSAHVLAHFGLGRRVAEMVSRLNQGSPVPLVELTVFLRQWLISHILLTDKALGVALNAKGVY
jgi:hemerythrin-like metal-binding protein